MKYDHKKIESKWQTRWEKLQLYEVKEEIKEVPRQARDRVSKETRKKFYCLDMFPYPSAEGLHVGHPEGYTASDIIARYMKMRGFNVLHPMGWDAFGLPTENYAIKTGIHPQIATEKNIKKIKKQIKNLGFAYDWSREINTTDPEYYKWTQWIFLQMWKRGLAYEAVVPINFCPSCKTGLANEEVVNGRCERCKTKVAKKDMRQWMLKITAYAKRLLKDLDLLDWPEQIKEMQKNWIGKSEGVLIKFPLQATSYKLQATVDVFTTRADTLFGATYLVLAPEHKIISNLESRISNLAEVKTYIKSAKQKSDLERTSLVREKAGIELKGIFAINPATKKKIPIWCADYVLLHYGTGAIMAVPAHDQRDFDFAKKYDLSIVEVISPPERKFVAGEEGGYEPAPLMEKAYEGEGVLVNSEKFNGMESQKARLAITKFVGGRKTVNYKLRDWIFSRQRYWGEPIPLVFCEQCTKNKPKILYIHGIYGNIRENWVPWLKDQMEKDGYKVLIPELPNFDNPDPKQWVEILKCLDISKSDKLYIIGHSYGALVACKYVVERGLPVEKIILVGPIGKNMTEKNWENLRRAGCSEESIKSVKKLNKEKINWHKLNNLVGEAVLYFSDNDPYIPLSVEDNYKKLNHKKRLFISKGHFNAKAGVRKLPEILEEFPDRLNLGWVPIPENQLPLELPEIKNYKPTGTGESPLAAVGKWVNTKCPRCGEPAKRETNTMPQWAGSCWYYLAYLLGNKKLKIKNKKFILDRNKIDYWLPVDLYVGGAEHAVLHLLYARFWHKFLYDEGYVNTPEPFMKLKNQGLVLGEDGQKMSKSRGNVINPDDVISQYGADTMRMYEMFMGPFEDVKPWSTKGIIGIRRFLERVFNLVNPKSEIRNPKQILNSKFKNSNFELNKLLHKTIKKVTEDIENFKFNTAISAMMVLINQFMVHSPELRVGDKEILEKFLLILSPFAPHLAEELWERLGHKKSIFKESWPAYDKKLIKEDFFELVVQINGRVRDRIKAKVDISQGQAFSLVKNQEKIKKYLAGKKVKKVIYIPKRLINIVV